MAPSKILQGRCVEPDAFFSWEKQVFLVGFSLAILRFLPKSKNRLNTSLLYYKLNNKNFQNKTEELPNRPCLTVIGGIQRTCRGQLYDELGLHSLVKRHWCNKVPFL